MVTSCNLAFTHRNRLSLSLQGQMHLLNALIVHGSPSQWDVFRTRDELVPVPSGPVSSRSGGGVGVHLSSVVEQSGAERERGPSSWRVDSSAVAFEVNFCGPGFCHLWPVVKAMVTLRWSFGSSYFWNLVCLIYPLKKSESVSPGNLLSTHLLGLLGYRN